MTETKSGTYAKLAKAFEIFAKYDNSNEAGPELNSSTYEAIYVSINPGAVTDTDIEQLEALGWIPKYPYKCFMCKF